MNSFMSREAVSYLAGDGGVCGEQAVSRAAQAANVSRRFKVESSAFLLTQAILCHSGPRPVKYGLRGVTEGYKSFVRAERRHRRAGGAPARTSGAGPFRRAEPPV